MRMEETFTVKSIRIASVTKMWTDPTWDGRQRDRGCYTKSVAVEQLLLREAFGKEASESGRKGTH